MIEEVLWDPKKEDECGPLSNYTVCQESLPSNPYGQGSKHNKGISITFVIEREGSFYYCKVIIRLHFKLHCNKNPIYIFPEKELRGLSPNFNTHVSVSDLYISRIGPHIFLQQNRQNDRGNI
jgi:hypothetical protein